MRIREVRASNGEGAVLVLSLHRELTVVTGLVPDDQVELGDILAAVIYGRTDGLAGVVELHGVEMGLESWATAVGEELDAIDVFVRSTDIPTEPDPAEAARAAARRDQMAQAEAAVALAEQALLGAQALRSQMPTATAPTGPDPAMAGRRSMGVETRINALERELAEALQAEEGAGDDVLEAERAAASAHEHLTACLAEQDSAAQVVARTASRCAELEEASTSPTGPDGINLQAARDAADATLVALDSARRHHEGRVALSESLRAALSSARDDLAEAEGTLLDEEAASATRREHVERASAASPDGPVGEEALLAAELAMAEAETAAAEAAAAGALASNAAENLARARAEEAALTGLEASADSELALLEQRSEQLDIDLARAEAEESLFAGFADGNRSAGWREPQRGRSGRSQRRTSRKGPGGAGGAGADRAGPGVADSVGANPPDALATAAVEERQATAKAVELRGIAEGMRAIQSGTSGEIGEMIARLDRAVAHLEVLEGQLEALGPVEDQEPVVSALAALSSEVTPRWRELGSELLRQLDAAVIAREGVGLRDAPRWLVDAARTSLEEARVELARAEEISRPMRFSPEDTSALEQAHAAVVEAEAKAERRFGGLVARRRLESAIAEERELLLKLGLPSYTAFLLRTHPSPSGSATETNLSEARRAMADAEAVWEELHQAENPEELAALEEQEASLLARVADFLGTVRMESADISSPATTLLSVRAILQESISSAEPGDEDPAGRLADALAGTSAPAGSSEDLVIRAQSWMAEVEDRTWRRAALVAEVEALRLEHGDLRRALGSSPQPEGFAPGAVEAAETAATEAEELAARARTRLEGLAVSVGVPAVESELEADSRWADQASAEVAQAQREIEVLQAERQSLDGRRTELRSGRGDPSGTSSRPRVEELGDALSQAEIALSAARRCAEEAADRAEAAIGAIGNSPDDRRDPEPDEVDADDALSRARARVEELREVVRRAELEAVTADDDREEAGSAVSSAEAKALQAAAEEDEAVARAAAAADALTAARQVHDQAQAALRDVEACSAAAETAAVESMEAAADARRALNRHHDDAERLQGELESARTAQAEAERAQVEADLALQQALARLATLTTAMPGEEGTIQGAALGYLRHRVSVACSADSFGPVPMILLEPFTATVRPPVGDLLGTAAGKLQVIFVTNDREVVQWAESLGPALALVVRFGSDASSFG